MASPSFRPNSTFDNFIPENITIPEEIDELRTFLKSTLEEHARLINRKDTGQYDRLEVQANQTFPGATIQEKRDVFRIIIDCGALPNNATKTVAHGITSFSNIIGTRVYGTATRPNSQILPLPFVDVAEGAGNVQVYINTVDVVIATTSDRTPYTQTWVVIEYYRT